MIQNGDPAGVGFNDTTVVSPVGGNPGTTLGQQRLNAFQAAANVWGATLNSGPTITALSTWVAMTCSANSAVVGLGGTVNVWRDFAGALVPNRWYSAALANELAGSDLNPANPQITVSVNVNLGNSGCLTGIHFYLGLDNNHGSDIDLIGVVLHELAHGLGFQTYTDGSTGEELSDGTPHPSIFDDFLLDDTTGLLWPAMTNAQRVASAINTLHLVWNGPNVTAAVPSVLTSGFDGANRPQMYAPNPYQSGSSVTHWDLSATPDQIMEPVFSSDLSHSVTPPQDLTAEMLLDIGWTGSIPATPSLTSPANGATGVSITPALSWSPANGAASYDVYFGTTSTPVFAANTVAASYNPGTLAAGTTYYWRVVAKNGWGSSSSTTWSFTTSGTGTPAPVSITPNAGNGASQTFSYVFSDSGGYATIGTAQMDFSSTLSGANACWIYFARASNKAWVSNDAGSGWVGPITLGTSGTVQNSQCTLNALTSSSTGEGVNLTVNLALTFPSGFAGLKNGYANVTDNGGLSSPWVQLGSWTVPGAGMAPTPVSVSPSSGTGASQTFSFILSDTNGFADIRVAQFEIASTLAGAGTCWIYFGRAANRVWVSNDAGSGWVGPITLGTSGRVQNSQCTLNAAASSSSGAGNNLTVNLALSFAIGYAGGKNAYAMATDNEGLSSPWVQLGIWTVPGGTNLAPVVGSVAPASGSGSSATFSFTFSDGNGASDINLAQLDVAGTLTPAHACFLYYARASNRAYLSNDAGTGWLGPVVVGSAGSLANSQCTLNGPTSSVTALGNNLTLSIALTFTSGFLGAKNTYALVQDNEGASSGWVQTGAWTVP